MIGIKLIGGLGNQMFQYAAARGLAAKLGTQVYFDISAFKEYKVHKFGLDNFKLKGSATNYFVDSFFKFGFGKAYSEPGFSYNSTFLDLPNNTYLEGYFQSAKYFEHCATTIQSEFTPKVEIKSSLVTDINETQSVAVHIRRGDYLSNPDANRVHGVLPMDYYKYATEIMLDYIGSDCKFFIFSDDIAWVQENLPLKNSYFVRGTNAIEDLFLMSKCKHNIIANSTFSWWSAWLNKNNNKKVLVPSPWFRDDKMNAQTVDLIPSTWQKVGFNYDV